jgi:hypothetical protein
MSYDFIEEVDQFAGITNYKRRREEQAGDALVDSQGLVGITNYKRRREEQAGDALIDSQGLVGITHYKRRREEYGGDALIDGFMSGVSIDGIKPSLGGITNYKRRREEQGGDALIDSQGLVGIQNEETYLSGLDSLWSKLKKVAKYTPPGLLVRAAPKLFQFTGKTIITAIKYNPAYLAAKAAGQGATWVARNVIKGAMPSGTPVYAVRPKPPGRVVPMIPRRPPPDEPIQADRMPDAEPAPEGDEGAMPDSGSTMPASPDDERGSAEASEMPTEAGENQSTDGIGSFFNDTSSGGPIMLPPGRGRMHRTNRQLYDGATPAINPMNSLKTEEKQAGFASGELMKHYSRLPPEFQPRPMANETEKAFQFDDYMTEKQYGFQDYMTEKQYGFQELNEGVMVLEGLDALFDFPAVDGLDASMAETANLKLMAALDKRRAVAVTSNANVTALQNKVDSLDKRILSIKAPLIAAGNRGDMGAVRRMSLVVLKLNDQRQDAAKQELRFAKLRTIALALARNAATQIKLTSLASAAMSAGKPQAAAVLKDASQKINKSTNVILDLRRIQIQKWTVKPKVTVSPAPGDNRGDIPAEWKVGDLNRSLRLTNDALEKAHKIGAGQSKIDTLVNHQRNILREMIEARSAGLSDLDWSVTGAFKSVGSTFKKVGGAVGGAFKTVGGGVKKGVTSVASAGARLGKFAACGIVGNPAVGAAAGAVPGPKGQAAALASGVIGSACGKGQAGADAAEQAGVDPSLVTGKTSLKLPLLIGGGVAVAAVLALALRRPKAA